jgi:hypothetical protein
MHSTLDMASSALSHGRKIAGSGEDVAALRRLHFLAPQCHFVFIAFCVFSTLKRLICVGGKRSIDLSKNIMRHEIIMSIVCEFLRGS